MTRFDILSNSLTDLAHILCYSDDPVKFREDLMNIARTTLSSKILTGHKDYFSNLAVEAVLRLKGSGNLDAIQIIKKGGGQLHDSYLDEGKRLASGIRSLL